MLLRIDRGKGRACGESNDNDNGNTHNNIGDERNCEYAVTSPPGANPNRYSGSGNVWGIINMSITALPAYCFNILLMVLRKKSVLFF